MSKGRRYWKFTTVDEQDLIDLLNSIVDGLINSSGKSENELLNTIWVNALLQVAIDGAPNISFDPVHEKIIEAKLKSVARKIKMRDLAEVHDIMDHDSFLAWAAENGIPEELVQDVILHCSWRNVDMGWDNRASSWLREYLANGNPCSTAKIKEDAIAVGLISQDPQEWVKLKQLAWRKGYTMGTSYAEWKLPDIL